MFLVEPQTDQARSRRIVRNHGPVLVPTKNCLKLPGFYLRMPHFVACKRQILLANARKMPRFVACKRLTPSKSTRTGTETNLASNKTSSALLGTPKLKKLGPETSPNALTSDFERQQLPRFLGTLKGTEPQIFAENRRLSQIHPFSCKFKHLEGGAENCRKSQIGVCHLRSVTSVTFSSAPRLLMCGVAWR